MQSQMWSCLLKEDDIRIVLDQSAKIIMIMQDVWRR